MSAEVKELHGPRIRRSMHLWESVVRAEFSLTSEVERGEIKDDAVSNLEH